VGERLENPNPIVREINIELGDHDPEKGTIKLAELGEKTIMDGLRGIQKGQKVLNLRDGIADLTKGIYILTFKVGERVEQGKLVKF